MKKILILLLFSGLAYIAGNAQGTLTKPQKKPQKSQPVKIQSEPTRPQKTSQDTHIISTSDKPYIEAQEIRPQSPVSPALTGTINGHEYVDLGLSVKWATCNVGASKPSDYGDYFAWGETSPKSEYSEANSATYNKSMGDIYGNLQYDAARANWGSTWRLPTLAEINELVNKCKHQWTIQDGHTGYLVTGPNGKTIFLPAAGWCRDSSSFYIGEYGYYWSSTPDERYTNHDAFDLGLNIDFFSKVCSGRFNGIPVRPVSD